MMADDLQDYLGYLLGEYEQWEAVETTQAELVPVYSFTVGSVLMICVDTCHFPPEAFGVASGDSAVTITVAPYQAEPSEQTLTLPRDVELATAEVESRDGLLVIRLRRVAPGPAADPEGDGGER